MSNLCILTAVFVITQLAKLTDILVNFGISLENIFLPFLFIFLPFLSFIIPMSFFFSVFLVFNKMNSDNEYVTLVASGYSLIQILKPVLRFALVLYLISTLVGFFVEPWSRQELLAFYNRKAQNEIENIINHKLQSGVFVDDFIGFSIYAEKVSEDKTHLENILIVPYKSENFFILFAPTSNFLGSVENNNLKLSIDYGITYHSDLKKEETTIIKFKKSEIDLVRLFKDKIFGRSINNKSDYLSMYPYEFYNYLKNMKQRYTNLSAKEQKNYHTAQFIFYQKLLAPLIVWVFGILGAVFGIYDPRTSKNYGYALVLGTIIIIYLVEMLFRGWAQNGYLHGFWAVSLPISFFILLSIFLLIQKNSIPPSELAFNPRYLPFIKNLFKKQK